MLLDPSFNMRIITKRNVLNRCKVNCSQKSRLFFSIKQKIRALCQLRRPNKGLLSQSSKFEKNRNVYVSLLSFITNKYHKNYNHIPFLSRKSQLDFVSRFDTQFSTPVIKKKSFIISECKSNNVIISNNQSNNLFKTIDCTFLG